MITVPVTRNAANDSVYGSGKVKLKIGDFRSLIESLNFSRGWLTGGTASEFKKQNIPGSLQPKIAQLQGALPLVADRYANDIQRAHSAIEHAADVIDRWHLCQ